MAGACLWILSDPKVLDEINLQYVGLKLPFVQACRPVWAKFYVRFAQLMKEKGLSLWGFSVQ